MNVEKSIILNDKNYFLKRITYDYSEEVLKFFEECKEFFILTEGRVPEDCKEFFYDLPPNKEIDDKYSYGVFYEEMLVGVIDIVKDYPEEGEWIIGLMLLHPKFRGVGLGRAVHNSLVEIVKEHKGNKLRIGVVEQNKDGLAFWKTIGYETLRITEPRTFGIKECRVYIMNYKI